jgi:hypothetical protein
MEPTLIEPAGYPAAVFFIVLGIGLMLAFVRPYWAFLFAIIIFSAANIETATHTRISGIGAFFNLYDALFIVALLALFMDQIWGSKAFMIPFPVILILVTIIIGSLNTVLLHHIKTKFQLYNTLRSIRWSLDLPLAFLISANIVSDEDRAKTYLYAAILGAVIGSLGSVIEYKLLAADIRGTGHLRLQLAAKGLSTYLLTAAAYYSFFKGRSAFVRLVWGVALMLFGFSVLVAQWRAVYLAIIVAIVCLPIIIGEFSKYARALVIFAIGIPVVLGSLMFLGPKQGPSQVFSRFSTSAEGYRLNNPDNITRTNVIWVDLQEWYQGNWLIGQGFNYSMFEKKAELKKLAADPHAEIAWGHVGYSMYLSNLGLLGFFVYGIYLPWIIFFASRRLYFSNAGWIIVSIGMLGLTAILMETVVGFLSFNYLQAGKSSIGFLYGVVWILNRKLIT